jgi:hypothetical protein
MAKKPQTPDLDTPAENLAAPETSPQKPVQEHTESAFASSPQQFDSFDAFYPHFLSERSNSDNCRLQVIGMGAALICLINVVLNGIFGGFWSIIWAAIFVGGSSYAGDHFLEKIKPGIVSNPAFTIMAQFKMFFEVVTRKRPW